MGVRRRWNSLVIGGMVLLGACSSATPRTAPIEGRLPESASVSPSEPDSRPSSKITPSGSSDTQVFALPEQTVAPTAPVPLPGDSARSIERAPELQPPTDPALRELLASAELADARGDRGAARATLERALKIKPADAQLWLRLAELNFAEGEYEQAIVMGQRARELAHGEVALITRSDALVSRARQQLVN